MTDPSGPAGAFERAPGGTDCVDISFDIDCIDAGFVPGTGRPDQRRLQHERRPEGEVSRA